MLVHRVNPKNKIKTFSSFQIQLKRVGLLHDMYRTHFYLSSPKNEPKPQVCPGKVVEQPTEQADRTSHNYHVNVVFESRMLGCYKQWVFFDFGAKPVLIRKLFVSIEEQHNLPPDQESIVNDRAVWNSSDYNVVRYDSKSSDSAGKGSLNLEAMYKLTEFHAEINSDDELSPGNYRDVMHHMLRLEEMEYQDKLSR